MARDKCSMVAVDRKAEAVDVCAPGKTADTLESKIDHHPKRAVRLICILQVPLGAKEILYGRLVGSEKVGDSN